MKYLIVGLGNIGDEYSNTRHNIGFKVLDAFAKASSSVFKPDRYGDRCEIKHKGRTFVCIKPSTFMNLSGKAVKYWLQKEKLTPERLLIITNDIALPFGTLNARAGGPRRRCRWARLRPAGCASRARRNRPGQLR